MASKIQILSADGSAAGEFEIKDESLEFKKGEQAVHDVVVTYLANQRAGTAATKNRSKVRGGGQKPFRQKGLGRARSGSSRNPIWVGGGTIFGPTPGRRVRKTNKKVAKLALKRAFSERVAENAVKVVDDLRIPDHKTKNVQKILDSLDLSGTTLMAVRDYDENMLRATGNILGLTLVKERSLNTYHLLRCANVIFSKEALEDFTGRLAGKVGNTTERE